MDRRTISPTVAWLTTVSLILALTTSLLVGPGAAKGIDGEKKNTGALTTAYPELSRYATNLTTLARRQGIRKTAGLNSKAVEQAITS